MTDRHIPGVLGLKVPARGAVPVCFDSPHSGSQYPPDFDTVVPTHILRRSEDMFVDELFAAAPDCGIALLWAEYPRCYIDPNRARDDLDLALMSEPWPDRVSASEKVRLGHGLVWRLCPPDLPLYTRRLSVAEVRRRIDRYYDPYHGTLKAVLDDLYGRFGAVWHVNCHSMPAITAPGGADGRGRGADFVLGDRDGTSCSPAFTQFVRQALRGMGYRVRVNDPYKGVELIRAYADPAQARNSLQIEINRALYMNEATLERTANFDGLKRDLGRLTGAIADYARAHVEDAAAE